MEVLKIKFSLIQIYSEKDGHVDGIWIQDYTGSLNNAIKEANETERANSNRIKVAVVEKIGGHIPEYNLLKSLKRLG
ncbi:hypothetical protein ABD91_20710 [Lysinibacillus sphaericus]|uniref:hypothetical protein n=1 Tax=Lysinibacillus sphaericus TaxID=1421 RepID=UPI0018CEE5DF|nr:hypothetical protein [Lysinibacillus sphaericus]MBG9693165.1 hypothetical protein [Lysinibacillus sphaericus]